MNIDDVKDVPKVKPELFMKAIFDKQLILLEKYKDIEGIPDYPFDIDDAVGQIWIKDFLWRTCEEVAESMEANRGDHIEHQIEELSDALHFIIEAMILAGVEPEFPDMGELWDHLNLYLPDETYEQACLEVLYWTGMTGNTLKNKKWKQTQMQTDADKFEKYIKYALNSVLGCFKASGCSPRETFVYYFKKSEVNKFRQRSNY